MAVDICEHNSETSGFMTMSILIVTRCRPSLVGGDGK